MKIAGAQFDVQFGQTAVNLEKMQGFVRRSVNLGAQLTVFPECALTGYCFQSLDEALQVAEPIDGPASQALAELCARLNTFIVFGMLEHHAGQIYNAAVLVGPEGVIGSYRKIHLPFLGVDRFTSYGNRPFAVHRAGEVCLGMNICYDASFPESARCLMLQGAELIVLPTNWPPGAQCVAKSTISCRALENGVYMIAVNRIGTERGFRFIGQSQLCNPAGSILHCSPVDREDLFVVDIDPEWARRKHVIRVPLQHEIDRLADRRPEMYHPLVEPHHYKSPGRP